MITKDIKLDQDGRLIVGKEAEGDFITRAMRLQAAMPDNKITADFLSYKDTGGEMLQRHSQKVRAVEEQRRMEHAA